MAPDQVTCLVNLPGAGIDYIDLFDEWPVSLRKRVRESIFNLCPACLVQKFYLLGGANYKNWNTHYNEIACLEIIEQVEKTILAAE